MIQTTLDSLCVGDLVASVQISIDDASLGVIVMIAKDKKTVFYFIKWITGFREGYTTAHTIEQIEQWQKNLKKILDNSIQTD
jgi:hypothetical protein